MRRGLVAGFQAIDIKCTLFDGSSHDVDSSEAAYKVAASLALKEAAKKCNPVILEPIMKIEVTVPEQYYGDVIGDITRRRGNILVLPRQLLKLNHSYLQLPSRKQPEFLLMLQSKKRQTTKTPSL